MGCFLITVGECGEVEAAGGGKKGGEFRKRWGRLGKVRGRRGGEEGVR